jgi:uncharacterized protein
MRVLLRGFLAKASVYTLMAVVLGVNAIAFIQARSMTHFVEDAKRTPPPEKLSRHEKLKLLLTGVTLPRPQNLITPQDIDLEFDRHYIALNTRERLEGWFIPGDSAQGVVVMFPPYATSKSALLKPAQILHEMGFSIFMVDFRGVGDSTGSETKLGYGEAADVVAAVEYVEQNWQGRPMVLYGTSMGASAVMRAIAVHEVKPKAVILESPFDRLLSTVRHRFDAMGVPSFPAAELLVFWGGVQQRIDGFGHNPVDYAKRINVPVLVMYGRQDQRVTLKEIETILSNFPGKKRLMVMDGKGHGSLASDNDAAWRTEVNQFLVLEDTLRVAD